MDLDQLNEIASSMTNPVQCGRCWFGPVDHTGCASLLTHHDEPRAGGGVVSNCCPRCGWFVASLSAWPPWDGLRRSPVGMQVLRIRIWAVIVVVVRTASKALIIPFFLLKLGALLTPSLAPFLAFSYLIPWFFENGSLLRSVSATPQHHGPPRESNQRRPSQRRQNQRHQRRARNQPHVPTITPIVPADDDCCSTSRVVSEESRISASDALTNILQAVPQRIFLVEGEPCSLCLDEFPGAAINNPTPETLRNQQPPLVALRCGHVLHMSCAEDLVRAADARHVRCPLCREPVSLAGAMSARLFN